MSLAMKRLKNIGWLALVFLVSILLYPLSLNVASLHSDLIAVDGKILDTKREISFLQAELRTRASLQQLEEWNDVLYGYQSPTAAQFLEGEAALANLGGAAANSRPVMVAVSQSDGVAPAGVIGSPFARDNSGEKTVAPNIPAIQDTKAATKVSASEKLPQKQQVSAAIEKPVVSTRTDRLARIDEKLLSEDVLKDIEKRSKRERKPQ